MLQWPEPIRREIDNKMRGGVQGIHAHIEKKGKDAGGAMRRIALRCSPSLSQEQSNTPERTEGIVFLSFLPFAGRYLEVRLFCRFGK